MWSRYAATINGQTVAEVRRREYSRGEVYWLVRMADGKTGSAMSLRGARGFIAQEAAG